MNRLERIEAAAREYKRQNERMSINRVEYQAAVEALDRALEAPPDATEDAESRLAALVDVCRRLHVVCGGSPEVQSSQDRLRAALSDLAPFAAAHDEAVRAEAFTEANRTIRILRVREGNPMDEGNGELIAEMTLESFASVIAAMTPNGNNAGYWQAMLSNLGGR